jgi:putative spermidine/putrescine transport system substrate-binding protein
MLESAATDMIASIQEAYASGKLDRRQFLKISALAGLAGGAALKSFSAFADSNRVILCNYGGDAATAAKEVYGRAFEKSTGLKFDVDTTGPLPGKIALMVKSGNVTWDVADAGFYIGDVLGVQGMLEPLDYSIIDKNKVLKGFATEYAVAGYGYSSVLAYDTAATGGRTPESWADVWDLKNFPGKRMFSKLGYGDLEAALLADGIPRDKLYPLDVNRAFAKIAKIKDQCVFWGTGSESQEFLRDGEVAMGGLWNTRAFALSKDTKGRIVTVWKDGIFTTNGWAVPKGNPAGKNAMRLIASMQDPVQQVEILKAIGFGPVNPAAAEMVPEALRPINPSDPANRALQIDLNNEWWGQNETKVTSAYLDFISS